MVEKHGILMGFTHRKMEVFSWENHRKTIGKWMFTLW
jgi:hypothetical protein